MSNSIIIIGAGNTVPSTYKVKKGDTLSGIAARNGLTLDQLLALNPQIKNPNLIHTGDEITLYDIRISIINEAIEMLKGALE